MIVLSLFDGMSVGRKALEDAGIPVSIYYASEIDKHAIVVAQKNFSDTIQLGDVRIVRKMVESGVIGHVDYLIGGSPCQGFSFAGKQLAFDDPRSALFFEFVEILKVLRERNPAIRFLLENVKMKKEHLDVISMFMGVQPVKINSALVCAQNRVRYYWCNWAVSQPEDRQIYLRDIIEDGAVDREKSYCIDANYSKGGSLENYKAKSRRQNNLSPGYNKIAFPIENSERRLMVKQYPRGNNPGFEKEMDKSPTITSSRWEQNIRIEELKKGHLKNLRSLDDKAFTLLAGSHKGAQANGQSLIPINSAALRSRGFEIRNDEKNDALLSEGHQSRYLTDGLTYRKLTPVECERLQGLPDGYTEGVSNTQRYKMLGNGWQRDTIEHIFREQFKNPEFFNFWLLKVSKK